MAGARMSRAEKSRSSGRIPPSTTTVLVLVACGVAAAWAAAMLTPAGRVAYVYVFAYAEFYLGVITLVALSLTIVTGLIATDRLVLSIRQRVLLQSAHRAAGVVAVAALVAHVGTKVAEAHVRPIDVVVPFLAGGYHRMYLGFGTIAGFLMVFVLATGIARARFAGRGRPWLWRALHAVAYPMWPLALLHGLSAGRPAAPWVVVGYVLCVLGVVVALAVRLSVSLNRRRDFSSAGLMKPVGAARAFQPAAGPAPVRRPSLAPSAPAQRPSLAPSAPARRSEPVPAPAAEWPSSAPAASARRPEPAPAAPAPWPSPAPTASAPRLSPPPAAPARRSEPVSAVPAWRSEPVPAVARPTPARWPAPTPPEPVVARASVPRHAAEPDELPPDETPTLVDLAGRRARNGERRGDRKRAAVRRTRRTGRADDAVADLEYWRRLRREAQ